jgi:hypothetical protein
MVANTNTSKAFLVLPTPLLLLLGLLFPCFAFRIAIGVPCYSFVTYSGPHLLIDTAPRVSRLQYQVYIAIRK